ncbi:NEMP1 protein, partial [Polypterus senegalus]|nr:NEMP1 protein [Polypterus senegalus]
MIHFTKTNTQMLYQKSCFSLIDQISMLKTKVMPQEMEAPISSAYHLTKNQRGLQKKKYKFFFFGSWARRSDFNLDDDWLVVRLCFYMKLLILEVLMAVMAGDMKSSRRFSRFSAPLVVVLLFFLTVRNGVFGLVANPGVTVINIYDGPEEKFVQPKHFCYRNTMAPGWMEIWTRLQIRIRSTGKLKVTVVEDEMKLKELEQIQFWNLFNYFIKEQSNETTIDVELYKTKICFKVDPTILDAIYTIQPARIARVRQILNLDFYSFRSRSFSPSPQKSPFYLLVVGGWSFSLYIIQLAFRNMQLLLKDHWQYVIGYVTTVGFVSFAVCYRYGPLVEERSMTILSWALQIIGLLFIYMGIQVPQVSLAIIISAFCCKNLEYPVRLIMFIHRKLCRWTAKPAPPQLLTEEEYQKQGEVETQHALEELRKYCCSPDFSAWKAVSRLQSPKRFADFVEGSSHLTPNEVSMHEQDYGLGGSFLQDELFESDDDSSMNGEETVANNMPLCRQRVDFGI